MDFNEDFEEDNHQDQPQQQQIIPDYEASQPQQQNTDNQFTGQQNKPNQEQYASNAPPPEQKKLGACGFLQVEYYQPYFNVSTQEVIQRVKQAIVPLKPEFFDISRENPDLWGPIWIYTTLVFIIASVGNIQGFLSAEDKSNYHFYYNYVPLGALLVYIIGFGTPLLLSVLMKCFGNNITVFQTICMYGYSMAVYVPVMLLCIIPYDWAQWLFVSIGTLVSILFMVVNLNREISAYAENKKYLMYGIIAGIQILFLLFLKLYFFQSFYNADNHDSGDAKTDDSGKAPVDDSK